MKSLKSNIYFKILIITILVLLLLIPTTMVESLIYEREMVQNQAIYEVSDKWGYGQTITGPYLAIPYDKYVKRYSEKDSAQKLVKTKEWLYFLPEKLNVTGEIMPEKRYRGIYEVVVYESNFKISGSFVPFDLQKFDIDKNNIHFEKASLNIGITDLRGIEKQVSLDWNGTLLPFNSGTNTTDIVSSGINAAVPITNPDSNSFSFNINIDLKGSQNIYFTPVGKTTDVTLSSNWPTPSFTGSYLPDSREISEEGFKSNWNILHLNRNYPQSWVGNEFSVSESTFGTDLLLPVDNYKKSNRVAKYAILFLALTFTVFFFVEVLNKVFIHPIQYLLVGIALVVFYTLLLSISEHLEFNIAYLSSTFLTLLLVFGYTAAILKSKKLGGIISGILLILYGFIFTIIQMEDYALLIGSVGIFVILAIVMYLSRSMDWYNIRIGDQKNEENKPN